MSSKVYEFSDIFGREYGYDSRTTLARRIRTFMNSKPHGHRLTVNEYFYFMALFQTYHPERDTTVFDNVTDMLRVDSYAFGKKTKTITLLYKDGRPPRDVSWMSCISSRCEDPLKNLEVRIVLKNIIRPQLQAYIDYRTTRGTLECDVHGKGPTPSQIRVEHHNPDFMELVRKWYEGMGSPEIKLHDKDKCRFASEALTRSWWAFHRKYSNLRLLCHKGH